MWQATTVGGRGLEWIVEAHGCSPAALVDPAKLRGLFADLIDGLSLRPVGEAIWHQFPSAGTGPGGVTGLCLLAESHLACHTFPEHRSICLNVFCCQPRPEWDFASYLARAFGATDVHVRRIERPYTHERENGQLSELRRSG